MPGQPALPRVSERRRRLILAACLCAAGVLGWLCELQASATSVGLFAWLSPPLVAGVWLVGSSRAELRADALRLVGLAALLMIGSVVSVVAVGMRPVWSACAASAALQLAVLSPLVLVMRAAKGALERRWRERRGGPLAAQLVGQLAPALVWLPAVVLSITVHRPQGTLTPEDVGIPWPSERLVLSGAGGTRLVGLWFENPRARGAVLLLHGIGAEKAQFLPTVEALYRRGYHVLTYDQRNHGESGGATSTLGLVEAEDAARVWQELLDRTRGAAIPRVMLGVSLGGAVAQLAARRVEGLDGLILDSTFARIDAVARRWVPLGPLVGPGVAVARLLSVPLTGHDVLDLAPGDRAPRGVPALILHARGDPMIPFSEAEALAAAYGERATLVAFDGAHHGNAIGYDRARYDAAIDAFAASLERRCARTRSPRRWSGAELGRVRRVVGAALSSDAFAASLERR